MASIKAIPSSSVHLIQSGQVILSLENAIKELVENSLDAGATIIEVKVKNNGLDSIEVIDNGCGIKPQDWEGVALKHHTSKFSSSSSPTSDLSLADVSTFGFRGEALSSLCALAGEVNIMTATTEMSGLGVKLKFGRDGILLREGDGEGLERIARQRGTTVLISNLFQPFPVRRKEFERTSKREFAKALGVCLAYGLVPAIEARNEGGGRGGVRLTVDSIASNGKKTNHLKTDGKPSLRSAISSIWGPKSLDGLIPMDLTLSVQTDKAMARRENIDVVTHEVNVVGLISSAAFGSGRTSTDRQYLYVNGRPFSAPKLLRAINEVYKAFNPHQSPFVVLDLKMPRDSIDVNVSPDKREVFLHSELDLIEALRNGLERLYQPALSMFVEGDATQPSTKRSARPAQVEDSHEDETMDVEIEEESAPTPTVTQIPPPSRSRERARSASTTSARSDRSSDLAPRPTESSIIASTSSSSNRPSGISFGNAPAEELEYNEDDNDSLEIRNQTENVEEEEDELHPDSLDTSVGSDDLDNGILAPARNTTDALSRTNIPLKQTKLDTCGASWSIQRTEKTAPSKRSRDPADPPTSSQKRLRGRLASFARYDGVALFDMAIDDESEVVADDSEMIDEENGQWIKDDAGPMGTIPGLSDDDGERFTDYQPSPKMKDESDRQPEVLSSGGIRRMRVRCPLDRIRARYRNETRNPAQPHERIPVATPTTLGPLEDADISVVDPERAEAALSRVISKDDFERMEILGQFNSSFIIARLRHDAPQGSSPADDLFIIDQHASDEKYNFETLQQTTKIKAQTLFQPRKLELTSADEITAVDNLGVLEANGFRVSVEEDAAYGRGERIKLLAMPVSKDTVFDFKDLEEIIYLLQDRPPGTMVRCKKARAMFAMRACRKSVMFGKPLGKAQMVQVVRHLGALDQPWNCPHGRPTLRHLINLHKVTPKSDAGDRHSICWTTVDLS